MNISMSRKQFYYILERNATVLETAIEAAARAYVVAASDYVKEYTEYTKSAFKHAKKRREMKAYIATLSFNDSEEELLACAKRTHAYANYLNKWKKVLRILKSTFEEDNYIDVGITLTLDEYDEYITEFSDRFLEESRSLKCIPNANILTTKR